MRGCSKPSSTPAAVGTSLPVIACADAINVDIPSRDQLEASVRRLEAASLVETDHLRVRPTRTGKRLVRQSGRRRDGIRAITHLIRTAPDQQVSFPGQVSAWSLSEKDWRLAYERYVN